MYYLYKVAHCSMSFPSQSPCSLFNLSPLSFCLLPPFHRLFGRGRRTAACFPPLTSRDFVDISLFPHVILFGPSWMHGTWRLRGGRRPMADALLLLPLLSPSPFALPPVCLSCFISLHPCLAPLLRNPLLLLHNLHQGITLSQCQLRLGVSHLCGATQSKARTGMSTHAHPVFLSSADRAETHV